MAAHLRSRAAAARRRATAVRVERYRDPPDSGVRNAFMIRGASISRPRRLPGRRCPVRALTLGSPRHMSDDPRPADFYVHPQALCETAEVGANTRVWAFAHVLSGARIGRDCNICDHVFVENDVVL